MSSAAPAAVCPAAFVFPGVNVFFGARENCDERIFGLPSLGGKPRLGPEVSVWVSALDES